MLENYKEIIDKLISEKKDNNSFELQKYYLYDSNLSKAEKLVYTCLCSFTNKNRECFPSQETR